MNANDTTDETTPDAPMMRRVAAELVSEAPVPTPWERVVARAEGVEPVHIGSKTSSMTNRPLLLIAATFAVLALGLGALLLRGTEQSTVVPADAPIPSSAELEPTIATPAPTTTAVVFTPTPTSTDETTEQQPDTTTSPDTTPPPGIVEVEPVDEPAEAPPAVELTTTPVSEITRLPSEAWVVPGTTPAGFTPVYAVDEDVFRRVIYRDEAGNDLIISTDANGFGSGDTVEIGGQTWWTEASADGRVGYVLEVMPNVISVSGFGLDLETARPILESLVAGDDSVLPVEPLRTVTDPRRFDVLASGPDNDVSTIMRGFGVNGWYCLETSYPLGSSTSCGEGRNGALNSALRADGAGVENADGSYDLTLSSVVSPEVATVEVVFADGSTTSTVADDPTGQYDDHFWILTMTSGADDPFQDGFSVSEIRLLAADGTQLGGVPIPEFLS